MCASLPLSLSVFPYPCLLLPHAYDAPVSVTTTVWFLPHEPDTTFVPSSAFTNVGALRCPRSPTPSCPHSFLPQVNTRPSSAIAMQCAEALPPHTCAMGTPTRVEMRVGSRMLGCFSSSCTTRVIHPSGRGVRLGRAGEMWMSEIHEE